MRAKSVVALLGLSSVLLSARSENGILSFTTGRTGPAASEVKRSGITARGVERLRLAGSTPGISTMPWSDLASMSSLAKFRSSTLRGEPGHVRSDGRHALTLTVDGAKTPEKVPDELAYRHFILVTAEAGGASAGELKRRDAILERLGLSDADRVAYIRALGGTREQLEDIAQRRRQVLSASPEAAVQMARLKVLEDGMLDNAALQARHALTLDGRWRLDLHIRQHVKKRIVVYTAP